MTGLSYRITTLGCRVNKADSVALEREFAGIGYRKAGRDEIPDLWVVNTCAVTAEGMRKSRKAVRRCAQSGANVIVTGCAPELEPAVFRETKGVQAVVKNDEKPMLASVARGFAGGTDDPVPWRCEELVRVPVKVQDGCDRFCTYCVVPYLRGKPYSRALNLVTRDVCELREAGAGEVVICGIDLGSYRDPESGAGLEELIESVTENAGGMWVRISSLELSDVSDRLLKAMNEENGLCRYLHLPLQSGDAGVLSEMGRKYAPGWFRERIREIRDAVPGAGVTTDVMVGFPNESDEAFRATVSLLEEIGFSRAHVFRYSPRPLTASFSLGDPVDPKTKIRRAEELRRVARESAMKLHSGLVGRIIPVLVEAAMQSEPGHVFGRAENFSGVIIKGNEGLVGEKIQVRVTGPGPQWLRGERADKAV